MRCFRRHPEWWRCWRIARFSGNGEIPRPTGLPFTLDHANQIEEYAETHSPGKPTVALPLSEDVYL
jgi:hypothetical protein